MPDITPTKYTKELADALKTKGLEIELEHWDGHKHIDIYIPKGAIYIEIDGIHHFTSPIQIQADFKRNHYSDEEKFDTIHIPNELIVEHLDKISDAIVEVTRERSEYTK